MTLWYVRIYGWGCSSLVEHRTAALLMQVWFPGAARIFFSQSQLSVQTLLRVSIVPRVQSHAVTSRAPLHVVGMLRFMSLTQTNWACQLLLLCSRFCFCLYSPFNCISYHKFSRQHSAFFSLFLWSYFCLTGPFNYISLFWKSPSALIWFFCGWLGLKHKPTN